MQRHEGTFSAHDGTALFRQAWRPEPQWEPRAAILIVHGFAEHCGRHAWLATRLVERGYVVDAFDLRGHGKSAGPRAYVDRFERYLDDVDCFFAAVRAGQASRPVFVFGHSMGAQIAALWAIDRQPDVAGIILSSPAIRVAPNVFPLLRRFAGLVGRWLPRLRLVRLGCRCLSRDRAVVDAFRNDPLVIHDRFPARTGAEILRAGRTTLDRARTLSAPLLILQGTGDRVVDPAGAEELASRTRSADKTLKRYEGLFHELLSEPERDQVLADLLAWLDARC
ncbi:MAG: alpha/beta hydrolase [Thermoguttaceae bacterium]|jgi:alpha-beta hydrolase superfamily lysophospholipase|nr:alpha/beta hydrolase [Thermoguttaceae bacterium]